MNECPSRLRFFEAPIARDLVTCRIVGKRRGGSLYFFPRLERLELTPPVQIAPPTPKAEGNECQSSLYRSQSNLKTDTC
jgi:hypothetical protein